MKQVCNRDIKVTQNMQGNDGSQPDELRNAIAEPRILKKPYTRCVTVVLRLFPAELTEIKNYSLTILKQTIYAKG